MKVHLLVTLSALGLTLAAASCSSGLGNNLPASPEKETSNASTNLPVGLDIGVALADPAQEAVAAGVVVPPVGGFAQRDVVLVAFTTADDANGISRDTVTDGNGAKDVFVAAICAQDVDRNAFSQSLAGKFRHPRCVTCHSMQSPTTTAFVSAAAAQGQPHAGPPPGATFPNNDPATCAPCHVESTAFPVVGWQAPAVTFDLRGESVAALAARAQVPPTGDLEHFVSDARVLWALDSGILPTVGGRNGVADDDHDGIDEPSDTDGTPRTVPGGSEVFIQQIQDWQNAGFPVTAADAVCDLTLASRANGSAAAGDGASTRPQVVFVPNGGFSNPGDTIGTLYIAYQSDATDLVAGDGNAASDVFRTAVDLVMLNDGNGTLDLQVNGNATLVSARNGTTSVGNAAANAPSIGGSNGEIVAFVSDATDLVAGFTAGSGSDVYVRTIGSNTTVLVSHSSSNIATGSNGASLAPAVDATGTVVAFESDASDLIADDTNGVRDVFYADISGSAPFTRVRASVTSTGTQGSGGASGDASVQVSGSRTFVVFESDKTDLAPSLGATTNVYLYDSDTGSTVLLNQLRSPNLAAIGDGPARNPVIGPDGATVAFESDATNIDVLRDDGNNVTDVFLVETARVLAGSVLPYRFSLTTREATDADGPSTNPQFGSFATTSNTYSVGFAVYRTDATNLGTSDTTDLMVAFLDEKSGVLADFSASTTAGVAPLTVTFTDTSTGAPTAWQWDFDDDGTVDSTEQNPTYTFATPGTYSVKLLASNTVSSNAVVKSNFVRAIGVPVPDFKASTTAGEVPLTVTFSDNGTTEQPTAWSWDFGDGNTSAQAPPVTHTYSSPGTYTVALTATNEAGSATETKTDLIQTVTPVIASFTTSPDPASGSVPLAVSFDASTTVGATSYSWDFGDGATGSGETTSHTYASGGSFTVTLTAAGPIGNTDTATSAVTAAGSVTASFMLSQTSQYTDQTITLDASASTGAAPLTYQWDFDNDNFATIELSTSNATEVITVGTYFSTTSQTTYPIRLRVVGSGGGSGVAAAQNFTAVVPNENITISAPSDVQDAYIRSDLPANSAGTGTSMIIGKTYTAGYRRSLLQFDVSGIPANSTINSATVRLFDVSPNGTATGVPNNGNPQLTGTQTYQFRRLTTSWSQSTVTFNTPWTTAGGDFSGSVTGTITSTNADNLGFVTSTNLAADVQLWVDGTANHGWLLRHATETGSASLATIKWYATSEETIPARRPRLVINYTRPLP